MADRFLIVSDVDGTMLGDDTAWNRSVRGLPYGATPCNWSTTREDQRPRSAGQSPILRL